MRVELPPPVPMRLFVPDDLSLSFIMRFAIPLACYVFPDLSLLLLEFVVELELLELLGGPLIFISG